MQRLALGRVGLGQAQDDRGGLVGLGRLRLRLGRGGPGTAPRISVFATGGCCAGEEEGVGGTIAGSEAAVGGGGAGGAGGGGGTAACWPLPLPGAGAGGAAGVTRASGGVVGAGSGGLGGAACAAASAAISGVIACTKPVGSQRRYSPQLQKS